MADFGAFMQGFQGAEKQRADIANEELKRETERKRLELQNRQLDQQGAQFDQDLKIRQTKLFEKTRATLAGHLETLSLELRPELHKFPGGQVPMAGKGSDIRKTATKLVEGLIKTGLPDSIANTLGELALQGKLGSAGGKPFTLKPGETRFSGANKKVASVDPVDKPINPVSFRKPGTNESVLIDLNGPKARAELADAKARGFTQRSAEVRQPRSQQDLTGAQPKEFAEIRKVEVSTRNTLDATKRLRQQLIQSGDSALSFTGATLRVLSGVKAQVMAFTKEFGGKAEIKNKEVSETDLFEPALYKFNKFGERAAQSAAIQSNIIDLAYTMARAKDPGGRLSDKDVQAQINRIAAASGDSGQMVAALDEVDRGTITSLRNHFLVLNRALPEGKKIPFPAELEALLSKDKKGTTSSNTGVTIQGVLRPEGFRFRQGGNTFVVRGGQVVQE